AVRLTGAEAHDGGPGPGGDTGQPGPSWPDAFARVLAPFVVVALDTVPPVDASAPTDAFVATLTRRLVDLAAPALVAELHRHRDEGRLTGPDGAARFEE